MRRVGRCRGLWKRLKRRARRREINVHDATNNTNIAAGRSVQRHSRAHEDGAVGRDKSANRDLFDERHARGRSQYLGADRPGDRPRFDFERPRRQCPKGRLPRFRRHFERQRYPIAGAQKPHARQPCLGGLRSGSRHAREDHCSTEQHPPRPRRHG